MATEYNRSGHDTQAIFLVIVAHTMGMFGLSGGTGWLIGRFGRLSIITSGNANAAAVIVHL